MEWVNAYHKLEIPDMGEKKRQWEGIYTGTPNISQS